jgi:acyl transferase domain-containing protein
MGVGPGEYAAACWAGVFGLEDAMRLAIGDDPDPVSYSPPNLAVISSLSGEVARPGEMSCAAYWRDVRKRSGRAREGLQALQRIGIDVFVEVGPAPAILESASDGWPSGVLGLASLRPGRDEWQQMLESLAALYTRGVAVNWSGLGPGETSGRVRLPTYPFQRERHWIRAADLGKPLAGEASGGRWEYEIRWESAEAEEIAPAAAEESRAWLVFSDRQGCGDRLVELVRGGGEACLCVERGPRYGERSRERFEIAPSAPQDYRRLMDRWMKRAAASRRTIVFLWALDGEAAECPTGAAWIQEQQGFCGSALLLVQALAARRRGKEPPPSLVFVTRGTQSVQKGETPPGWGASTLWGLARVVALEHPEIPCLRIDLDARRPEDEMAMLAREIRQRSRETEVAFRGPRRFVPRLARSQEERPTVVSEFFQPSDGAYVVSGGFHGLGLKVVEWLLDRGARHVAVLSRSADSPSARSLCRRIGRPGVNLMALPVDVSRYGDLAEALRRVRDAAPGIRGVVHCAGVLDDGALFQQSWPRFERVLAPKVAGSWNLHLLTRNDPLDFFILFSSTAAVIGAMGQGNYAAANAFMDGLAHYRVGEGLPALSINWGPWSEVGMAAAISSAEQLRMLDRGLESIPPRRGIEILERLIRQHRPQASILPIDWERFAGHYPSLGRSPFLSRVCSAGEGSGEPDAGSAETGHPRTGAPSAILLASMPDSAAVESRILHYVQNIMQLPKGGIELQAPLNQMGLDSIMALELANRIAAELQVEIPVADLLDGITVADLLERVQLRSAAADPLPAGRPAGPEDVFSGQVDQLSDEEVERFLTMMLPQEKSTP